MRPLIDAPLSAGRPSPPLPPTEEDPRPHQVWPGWVWWYGEFGHPRAKRGDLLVKARHFRELEDRIRKVEGGLVRDQIAELEALFPGSGWQFGSVWQSVPSGPDARNLTARKDGVLLAAGDVPSLAEKIRHEEEAR